MPKLIKGQIIPDFTFTTPFVNELSLSETAEKAGGKTALLFLRYYGCTLCQLDMRNLAESYDEIAKIGAQVLVVLQSQPAGIAGQISEDHFPFQIICDPEERLYQRFEILPAKSKLKMLDAKAFSKIAAATAQGIKHGEYEGDEQQLPAIFIFDSSRLLHYVHYGKSVSDIPSPQELVKLLSET